MATVEGDWATHQAEKIQTEWCEQEVMDGSGLNRLIAEALRIARREGAESMRERAATEAESVCAPYDAPHAIRALPTEPPE